MLTTTMTKVMSMAAIQMKMTLMTMKTMMMMLMVLMLHMKYTHRQWAYLIGKHNTY